MTRRPRNAEVALTSTPTAGRCLFRALSAQWGLVHGSGGWRHPASLGRTRAHLPPVPSLTCDATLTSLSSQGGPGLEEASVRPSGADTAVTLPGGRERSGLRRAAPGLRGRGWPSRPPPRDTAPGPGFSLTSGGSPGPFLKLLSLAARTALDSAWNQSPARKRGRRHRIRDFRPLPKKSDHPHGDQLPPWGQCGRGDNAEGPVGAPPPPTGEFVSGDGEHPSRGGDFHAYAPLYSRTFCTISCFENAIRGCPRLLSNQSPRPWAGLPVRVPARRLPHSLFWEGH